MQDNENKKIIDSFWSIENRTKFFFNTLIFLSIFAIGIFCLVIIGDTSKNIANAETRQIKNKKDYFNIELKAKSAFVWDINNNRELFAKNADEPLALASLTKVMTAVTAEDYFNKNTNIKIQPEFLKPEGDSKLLVGDLWRAKDLLDFTLITSSNDGAMAVASVLKENNTDIDFVERMNQKAKQIGMENSTFFNVHGLDENGKGGSYGSARDMATLFSYALKKYPELLESTRYKNISITTNSGIYGAKNTNTAIDEIPNLVASKTGYTDIAGGNLVVAYDAGINHPIVVSVLGSTEEGRFEDILKLVRASLDFIKNE